MTGRRSRRVEVDQAALRARLSMDVLERCGMVGAFSIMPSDQATANPLATVGYDAIPMMSALPTLATELSTPLE